ncbi:hypothetical protein PSTG_17147 [Puccinia striiformis f. sp. tritici PST-78]|uniref:Uncharacterized protein n=1 Tax=Puccinia striiformis f. sp. tritici PST-78 TaxID=1165861 RepID=A0A0L0UR45_9BASI|nr:hypothetical protein PSTG_17147 [Puccinia striiformis f. sp. tritici PST-78]
MSLDRQACKGIRHRFVARLNWICAMGVAHVPTDKHKPQSHSCQRPQRYVKILLSFKMLLLTFFRCYLSYHLLRGTGVSAVFLPHLKSALWDDSTARANLPPPPALKVFSALSSYPITSMLSPMDLHRASKSDNPMLSLLRSEWPNDSVSPSSPISWRAVLQGVPQSLTKDTSGLTHVQEHLSTINPTSTLPSPSVDKRRQYFQDDLLGGNILSGPSTPLPVQGPSRKKSKKNLVELNNPKSISPKENNQYQFDSSTSINIDSRDMEILTNILDPDYDQVDQPPKPEPETLERRRRSVIKPSLPPGGYFSSRGQLHIALLKGYMDGFQTKIRSKELDATTNRCHVNPGDDHPELPFSMITRPFPIKGKVFRVMRGSSAKTQGSPVFCLLYKFLIGWLYSQHEELLNLSSLDMPVFAHRPQQEKLFSWLEKEIFDPDQSLPVVGIVKSLTLKWRDEIIGPSQMILIKYFSQDETNEVAASTTAAQLLRVFYAQDHRFDHLAPIYGLRAPNEISTSLDFQKMFSFVSHLIGDDYSAIETCFLPSSIDSGLDLLTWCSASFEHQCERATVRDYRLKTLHPKLPIAMYLLNQKSARPVLRVLKKSKESPLNTSRLYFMFKRLLKMINFFHIELLKKLNIDESNFHSRAKDLFQWLLKSIDNPDGSIPVMGHIQINQGLAPWEDVTDGVVKSFGQVQLKLLEYFSKDETSLDLKDFASFIITSWFQDHQPEEFLKLVQISTRN